MIAHKQQPASNPQPHQMVAPNQAGLIRQAPQYGNLGLNPGQQQTVMQHHNAPPMSSALMEAGQQHQMYASQPSYAQPEDQFAPYGGAQSVGVAGQARPVSNMGPQLASQMADSHHLYDAPQSERMTPSAIPRPYLVKHQPNHSQVPQQQAQQQQYQQQHYQVTQPQAQPQAPLPTSQYMEPANQYVPQMEQGPPQVSRAQGRMIQQPQQQQQQQQLLQQRVGQATYPAGHLQTTVRQQPMASAPARPMQEQYHPAGPIKNVAGYQQQSAIGAYEPAEAQQQQVSRAAYPSQQMTLQYSDSSPTLLQQQLNRNQAQPLPPPNQRQVQPLLAPHSQHQLHRTAPNNFASRSSVGGRQPQNVVRYAPEALDPGPDAPAGAYYQKGRSMVASRPLMEPQAVPHQVHLQQPLPGNPTPPLTPNSSLVPMGRALVPQQLVNGDQQWSIDAPQARIQMPKSNLAQPGQVQHFAAGGAASPYAQARAGPSPPQLQHQSHQLVAPQSQTTLVIDQLSQARLTLPRREQPLLGPFKLDHDIQFTSKVFHIKSPLFDMLSKSMSQISGPQAAPVIQELQFRAYTNTTSATRHNQTGDSLLAPHNHQSGSSNRNGNCNWPELFQMSVNQQPIQLDRTKGAHKPVDIFQFCMPGDNSLDIQVNDCYCQHEFILEAVDRPTIKAFMNSCFKSRLLDTDGCIQKLKFHFGGPNFLVQTANGIINEYLTEFVQGVEQTRAKISLRCPISGRRMRTPTRGHDCRHLQCFDLERFLLLNKDRNQWSCPICSLSIPFNMLELDQHQINIIQSMSEMLNVDEILMDLTGNWLAYSPNPQPTRHHQALQGPHSQQHAPVDTHHHSVVGNHNHQVQQPQQTHHHHQHQMVVAQTPQPATTPTTAKSTGIYHPQPMAPRQQQQQQQPIWDGQHHVEMTGGPVRRPASAMSGQQMLPSRRPNSSSPLAKKPYAGQFASNGPTCGYSSNSRPSNDQQLLPNVSANGGVDELSPLAAMERTIIQHEQQMGPPPFDPTSLTASPARTSSSSTASNSTSNNPSMISPSTPQLPLHVQSQTSSSSQASPQHEAIRPTSVAASFSPAPPAPGTPVVPPSPSQRVIVPASPQQQAQSPLQPQPTQIQPNTNSTPVTPSSSLLVHGGPETPATPSNSGQHQQQLSNINHNSSHVTPVNQQQPLNSTSNVDHQPLSNGSASAGSITSSSTMTPSGQSLGSVGMGGDSRCGTAPLPGTGHLGLDELLIPGVGSGGNQASNAGASGPFKQSAGPSQALDADKTEILMNKLMMDSSESLLRSQHGHSSELAMALEDAEWRQQLDRGKSEHLANFLNEPMIKRQNQQQHQSQQPQQQHYQSHVALDGIDKQSLVQSGNFDDDNVQSHNNESPSQNDLADFSNYLDADTADDGAGLPPDDSILDLFER